jgi:hypothetical protein
MSALRCVQGRVVFQDANCGFCVGLIDCLLARKHSDGATEHITLQLHSHHAASDTQMGRGEALVEVQSRERPGEAHATFAARLCSLHFALLPLLHRFLSCSLARCGAAAAATAPATAAVASVARWSVASWAVGSGDSVRLFACLQVLA